MTALCPYHSLQVNWMMFVQESVLNSVVARLKKRMEMMKCVALRSDQDKVSVEAVVLEAAQQGVMVSPKNAAKADLCAARCNTSRVNEL